MTQSRKVCRSMAQSLAASPRAYPSSTNASPNIRRAALASLLHAAACRKSVAVRSARIIVNAFGIEPSANHDQPAENHISACLRRPAESKVSAAGISGYLHTNPVGSVGFIVSACAQSPGPDVGRHLAETVCSACHKIEAYSQGPGPNPNAPNFVDISLMPSMSELAIKVFLRSPHPSMPNIILSSEEIDSIAAYIKSLNKK